MYTSALEKQRRWMQGTQQGTHGQKYILQISVVVSPLSPQPKRRFTNSDSFRSGTTASTENCTSLSSLSQPQKRLPPLLGPLLLMGRVHVLCEPAAMLPCILMDPSKARCLRKKPPIVFHVSDANEQPKVRTRQRSRSPAMLGGTKIFLERQSGSFGMM